MSIVNYEQIDVSIIDFQPVNNSWNCWEKYFSQKAYGHFITAETFLKKNYIWLENHMKCLWLIAPIYSPIVQYNDQNNARIELEMSLKSSLRMSSKIFAIIKNVFLKSFSPDIYANDIVKTENWWGIKGKFLCSGPLFIDFFLICLRIVYKSIFLTII